MKASKKTAVRKNAANPANIDKVVKAMRALQPKVKAKELSKCEAVRKIAKQLGTVRRIEIEVALVKHFAMNKGTVARQIQDARA